MDDVTKKFPAPLIYENLPLHQTFVAPNSESGSDLFILIPDEQMPEFRKAGDRSVACCKVTDIEHRTGERSILWIKEVAEGLEPDFGVPFEITAFFANGHRLCFVGEEVPPPVRNRAGAHSRGVRRNGKR